MMNCPKCAGSTEKVVFENIEVDRCTACKGIWFDGGELQRLKRTKGAEAVDTGSEKEGRNFDAIRDIDCPVCGKAMAQLTDPYQRHIRYEACPEGHGAFLDAGEFRDLKSETLLDFFKSLRLRSN